jgi:hypothetical protein
MGTRNDSKELAGCTPESSFTHPSTYQLFCYQFGVAAAIDQERIEEHLVICGPCRDALCGVERSHPSADSLKSYALGRLYFSQGNVIRLHATKCSYCEQVVQIHRIAEQNRIAVHKDEEAVEVPTTSCASVTWKKLQPFDAACFFELGGALSTCLAMVEHPIQSYQTALATLKTLLGELYLAGDFKQQMERAAVAAAHLLGVIEGICDRHGKNIAGVLSDEELLEFSDACTALERGITSDLRRAAVYCLDAKNGLDARKLMAGADEMFRDSLDRLPPGAANDINQAGTCLALCMSTGAAFHIVRATKTVIQGRIEALGVRAPVGYERNLRGYVRALREISGRDDYRLEPLMDIWRDPVSDPEVTVTMAEAAAIWATCTDAIRSIIDCPDSSRKLGWLTHSA